MDAIGHALLAALLVAVAAIAYRWHVGRYPTMPCLKCGGTGKARLGLRPWGPCRRCGGKGTRRRFGAVVLRRPK